MTGYRGDDIDSGSLSKMVVETRLPLGNRVHSILGIARSLPGAGTSTPAATSSSASAPTLAALAFAGQGSYKGKVDAELLLNQLRVLGAFDRRLGVLQSRVFDQCVALSFTQSRISIVHRLNCWLYGRKRQ